MVRVQTCSHASPSYPLPQFLDPAEKSPSSVRALDVAHGGGTMVLGTSRCDIWEVSGAGQAQPLVQGHSADVYGLAFHPTKPYR